MLLETSVGRTKFKSTAQTKKKKKISWLNQSLVQEREDAFNSQRNLTPCERGSQAVLKSTEEILSGWPLSQQTCGFMGL